VKPLVSILLPIVFTQMAYNLLPLWPLVTDE
jgi:hypothetical protein